MKAKVFLYLAAGLVVFLLGSFVTTQMVDAQIHTKYPMPDGTKKILWDYDSGWEEIVPAEHVILEHNVGGDPAEYFVYVLGKDSEGRYHQNCYGLHQTGGG